MASSAQRIEEEQVSEFRMSSRELLKRGHGVEGLDMEGLRSWRGEASMTDPGGPRRHDCVGADNDGWEGRG